MVRPFMLSQYVLGWLPTRLRRVFLSERDTGALSLEWIVIGAIVVILAGTVAYALFKNAITAEGQKLP